MFNCQLPREKKEKVFLDSNFTGMNTQNPWESFKKYWHATSPADNATVHIEKIFQAHPIFNQAIRLSGYGFCVIDIPTMQYLYMCDNIAEIAGWTKEEYLKGGVEFAKREQAFKVTSIRSLDALKAMVSFMSIR